MDENQIRRTIELSVIRQCALSGEAFFVPAAVSARHVHLCAADIETLFGKGCALQMLKALVQPDQFACEQKVTLVGKKGRIENIRVLGPSRPQTQVEVSMTDCYKLGIKPDVRMSGDLAGTPGGTLIGPAGEVKLQNGVIVSARHLHASQEQASWFGLKNGDIISVRKTGVRETVFGNVVVRVGAAHELELHFDTEDAGAAGIKQSELLELHR